VNTLIEVRGLRKRFRLGRRGWTRRPAREVIAVEDVSFDIREGETLGCVGGSGSGKSTLGRLILNLLPADAGSVRFDGVDLARLSRREMRPYRCHLQIVWQDPLQALNPRRTVAENMARPLLNFGASHRDALGRVRELLELVGLDPTHANRYPHEFSGGQCQRIVIARALALRPRFLFLDEPVSALDVSIQAQILNLLKDLQERFRLTYLFVAHDLKIVKHFSDRIIVLYHGRAVEAGPSEALYHRPLHPYSRALLDAVLTVDGDERWRRVAAERGTRIPDDEEQAADLHDASACVYARSCPERFEPCSRRAPALEPALEGAARQQVACHLYTKKPGPRPGV